MSLVPERRPRGHALLLVACLSSIFLMGRSTLVEAQDAGLQQAKQDFDDGQNLYLQSKYSDAADKFLAAYRKKPFPAFLFNAGVCYEKNRDFMKALTYYERFLKADPHSADKTNVQERIDIIREYLNPPEKDAKGVAVPKPITPNLPAIETKGLVVIESNPEGAAIYLDERTKGIFTRTPYTGSLPPGQHQIELEMKGFDPVPKNVHRQK